MTSSRLMILAPSAFRDYDRGVAYKPDGFYRLHWNPRQMNTTKCLSPHLKYLFAFVLNLNLEHGFISSSVCIYPTRSE
jgi:hypothetical protein